MIVKEIKNKDQIIMIEDLRIECEVLRVKLRLNKRGSYGVLAAAIGANSNSLNMALSGYRNGPGSEQLLIRLREHLLNVQNGKAAAANTT